MHLVDEEHLAVLLAELVLGVDQHETLLGGHACADFEEGAGVALHHLIVLGRYETLSDDFLARDVLVVTGVGLGGGGDDGFGETLVLAQTLGEPDAADLACAGCIFTPCAAGKVSADDHLHTEAFAAYACRGHGVDFGELPVGDGVAGGVKEVVRNLVQYLTLERYALGKDNVEGRDAVGSYHDEDVSVDGVYVADLAVIDRPGHVGELEVSACECHCL